MNTKKQTIKVNGQNYTVSMKSIELNFDYYLLYTKKSKRKPAIAYKTLNCYLQCLLSEGVDLFNFSFDTDTPILSFKIKKHLKLVSAFCLRNSIKCRPVELSLIFEDKKDINLYLKTFCQDNGIILVPETSFLKSKGLLGV